MARKQQRKEEEAMIDMTPMLDIVFIMLIFFIVSTSFLKEAGIEVTKPKAAQAVITLKANVFIAIRESGEIWMDKKVVDVERIAATIERLLAETPTDVIVIQADKDATHGVVVKVMDAIKAANSDLRISIAGDNT
ncbi:MAG: biopolymer transporter ExbD [Algicola sp.]|nr:biopolymer transporter ExbD [Algicola sp.]